MVMDEKDIAKVKNNRLGTFLKNWQYEDMYINILYML